MVDPALHCGQYAGFNPFHGFVVRFGREGCLILAAASSGVGRAIGKDLRDLYPGPQRTIVKGFRPLYLPVVHPNEAFLPKHSDNVQEI